MVFSTSLSARGQHVRLAWRGALLLIPLSMPLYLLSGTLRDWILWAVYSALTLRLYALERRGWMAARLPHMALLIYFLLSLGTTVWFSLDPSGFSARLHLGVLGYGILAFGICLGASVLFGRLGALTVTPLALLALTRQTSEPTWSFAAFLLLIGTGMGLELYRLHNHLEQTSRRLERMALIDSLTTLGNRRALSLRFAELWHSKTGLCVTMWDLNDLKSLNDLRGHAAGDLYLARFAEVLGQHSSATDAFFRTGGDEFVGLHHGPGAVALLVDAVRERFPSVAAGWARVDRRARAQSLEKQGLEKRAHTEGDFAERSLEEALTEADKMLYMDKQFMKSIPSSERLKLAQRVLEDQV